MSDDAITDGPAVPVRAQLTRRERRRIALWSMAPVPVVALLVLPFVLRGTATWSDLVGAVLVYGLLSGLTTGVVAHERLQARKCPSCGNDNGRRAATCRVCDYDLATQPRFACQERHRVHIEPGMCACGRRLHRLPTPRGIGREVRRMLWFGVWLFGVLVAVALLLPLLA